MGESQGRCLDVVHILLCLILRALRTRSSHRLYSFVLSEPQSFPPGRVWMLRTGNRGAVTGPRPGNSRWSDTWHTLSSYVSLFYKAQTHSLPPHSLTLSLSIYLCTYLCLYLSFNFCVRKTRMKQSERWEEVKIEREK